MPPVRRREPPGQLGLVGAGQRHGLAQRAHQRVAVADQEEGQVEHNEHAGHEAEGVLAEAQHLGGHPLGAVAEQFGQALLQGLEIRQADA